MNQRAENIFEKIALENYREGVYVIYENAYAVAFFTRTPSGLGHTLVLPKFSCVDFLDLLGFEAIQYMRAIQRTIDELEVIFDDAIGFSVGWNDGTDAGRSIDFLHAHIVPRFIGDWGLGVKELVKRAEPQFIYDEGLIKLKHKELRGKAFRGYDMADLDMFVQRIQKGVESAQAKDPGRACTIGFDVGHPRMGVHVIGFVLPRYTGPGHIDHKNLHDVVPRPIAAQQKKLFKNSVAHMQRAG